MSTLTDRALSPPPIAEGATMPLARTPGETLQQEIEALLAECRERLASRFPGLEQRLPAGRRSSADWFLLLQRYCRNGPLVDTLQRLREEVGLATGELEHYGLLQAMRVAAPQIPALPITAPMKSELCRMYARILRPKPQWLGWYDFAGWRFLEMAQFVTLERYPAGQHDWEVTGLARSWLAKARLMELPRLLAGLACKTHGFAPLARIHLNAWRANPLLILPREAERSYFRIAQSLPLQPQLKGLMAYSWFYSTAVRDVSPHLCWLRDFFAAHGAIIAEMERAPPDYGFMIGSARRRALYQEGRFRPRLTLILWPRKDMLAWAARQSEAGMEAEISG